MFGEEESGPKEAIPANEYVVGLINVSADLEGSAPRNIPFVTATFEIVKGEYTKEKLYKRFYYSEGTAKKFLPWQMGVLGIKKDLDEANCQSFVETAEKSMELMGEILGNLFTVSVEINDNGYNDLIVQGEYLACEDETEPSDPKAADRDEVVNPNVAAPPQMDAKEPLPF